MNLKAFTAMAGFFAAVLAQPVSANPAAIAPDGWQRSESNGLAVYQSQPAGEVMVFRTFEAGSDIGEKVALFADIVTARADRVLASDVSAKGPVQIKQVDYVQRKATMRCTVMGVRQGDGTVLVMACLAQKSNAASPARVKRASERMAAFGGNGAVPPPTAKPQTAPSKPPPITQTTGTGPKVERVLFDLKYKYGVGGAVYPTYHLVALLEGGQAVRLGSYATDAIDVSAIGRKKRGHVGTWRRTGGQYAVRWADGKTSDVKPSVGPPAPLPSARQLSGTYQAIGGGGNTALGGQTLAAEVKQFTFRSDGTFVQSSSKTASAPRVAAGSRSGTAGRWSLNGANLTLTYGNGRVVRTSVFYSAKRKGSDQYGVLWIGGEDYRRKR